MNSRSRIARIAAVVALGAAAVAAQAIEPCFKNHYILDEPCALDWTPVNSGLTDLDVRVLAVDPVRKTTLYAGGPSGVFKSTDAGAAWKLAGLNMATRNLADTAAAFQRFGNLPSTFKADSVVAHLAIDPLNPSLLYAGTATATGCTYLQRRLFKSADGGASWTDGLAPGINGCDNIRSLVLAPGDRATLYLANFDAMGDAWSPLVKTADGAATWTYLPYLVLNVLAVDPIEARTVYGGTFDFEPQFTDLPNGVLKSGDGGVTWEATGLTGTGITALTVDPAQPRTLYAATADRRGGPLQFRGLFKSVDGAATWAAVSDGLGRFIGTSSTVTALVVDADDSTKVYVAMAGGGISRSVDAGSTWTSLNDGLPSLSVRALALVAGHPNNTLYAGTSSGVFKRVAPATP